MKKPLFITVIVFVFCLAGFAQTPDSDCPSISVTGPAYPPRAGEEQRFEAKIGQVVERYNVEYVWSISSGKIVSGQGSKNLAVVYETGDSLTVTITVKGLPEKCPDTASESATIARANFDPVAFDMLDDFGRSGTKERIDNFLIELLNDKNAEGVVVFQNNNQVLKRIKYLRDYLSFRKFSHQRLTLVIADKDDDRTELRRIPEGAKFIEMVQGLVIKLEDFEPLQKLFTPKTVKPKTKK